MKWLLLLFSFLLSSSGFSTGCFSEHIQEAVELTRSRMPLYDKISEGESLIVSRLMLAIQRTTLLTSSYYQAKEVPFQKADVPVFCEDFVSMSFTPPFQEKPVAVSSGPLKNVPIFSWIRKIYSSYRSQGFTGVQQSTQDVLKILDEAKSYHCLTRHFLESIHRIALHAPKHAEMARAKNLSETPEKLEGDLIVLHLTGLPMTMLLDKLAVPVQKKGIPILCQDAPPLN